MMDCAVWISIIPNNLAAMIDLAREYGLQSVIDWYAYATQFRQGIHGKVPFHLYRTLRENKSVPLVPFLLEGVANRPEWMQGPAASDRARSTENAGKCLGRAAAAASEDFKIEQLSLQITRTSVITHHEITFSLVAGQSFKVLRLPPLGWIETGQQPGFQNGFSVFLRG